MKDNANYNFGFSKSYFKYENERMKEIVLDPNSSKIEYEEIGL
ncbi:hypothetical protein [Borrelia turicatae]|nr:hypothetical protein [Borrelia turicatae]